MLPALLAAPALGRQVEPVPASRKPNELVAQLAAATRDARLAAQEALLALGSDELARLDSVDLPPGFEARAALEYVRVHRPQPVRPVAIPAGTYRVGNDAARDRNPSRDVSLKAFRIDDCEVTCFEYWRFARATKTAAPPGWIDGRYPYGGERLPVGNVSPQEATRFAEWVGGRLPTSDEWEVAATGGTGRPFPWSDSFLPRLANASGGEPVEVRSEPQDRSPFGGFDFCASLREWVVLPDGRIVARGGSINTGNPGNLRLTRAPDDAPGERGPFIGLRVCDRKP